MEVTKRHIYHPFVNKSLGFSINLKGGTYSEEIFTDVNLHWQPVQDLKFGILCFIISFLLILAGCFLHYYLWQVLKREDNLVTYILKAYVVVQMIFFPFTTILHSATDLIYPLSEVTGSWFCVFASVLVLSLIHI